MAKERQVAGGCIEVVFSQFRFHLNNFIILDGQRIQIFIKLD